MSFLKGLGTGLLRSLLFLFLTVFGLALTLNMTVLNADFVTSRIDALDVSVLTEEIIDEQVSKGDFPEEFTEEIRIALVDAIDKLEPLVKGQLDASVYSTYDYLLGKKESPELALTLRETFLNSGFVASFLDELDISSLAEAYLSSESVQEDLPEEFTGELKADLVDIIDRLEPLIKVRISAVSGHIFDYMLGMSQSLDLVSLMRENILDSEFVDSLLNEIDIPSLLEDVDLSSLVMDFLNEQTSEDIPEEVEYLVGYVDEIIIELEPWMREQAGIVAAPVFDYLLGISQNIDLSVSLEPVKDALGDNLKEIFLESPPAELAGLSQTELDQYFDEQFGEMADALPSTFEIDESVLGDLRTDIIGALADAEGELEQSRQDITEALAEAEVTLGEAREYIGYFQTGFGILIVFMLLTILGIILISREVRGTSRILGIIFLSYGILELIGIFIARNLAESRIPWADMPSSLQTWLQQLISSSLTPLQTFCIVLIVAGAALLVVSFIYGGKYWGKLSGAEREALAVPIEGQDLPPQPGESGPA